MPPLLIINPRNDAAFVELAQKLVTDVAGPENLQARLRDLFPRVLVRPRDLSGEAQRVWYVYREGHWVSSTPEE